MISNMPSLCIRFNIGKIDSGAYGEECWRIFWKTIDPKEISISYLYEGDSASTLAGDENVYCIGIQSLNESLLKAICDALEVDGDFKCVAGSPEFVVGNQAAAEPLIGTGKVNTRGVLVGKSHNARRALAKIRKEKRKETKPIEKSKPVKERQRPASSRTASLPEVSSITELQEYLEKNFHPKPGKMLDKLCWISPEEVCDVVEKYSDFIQVQWDTTSLPYAEDVIHLILSNKAQFDEEGISMYGMFSFPCEADARSYCNDERWHFPYQIGDVMRNLMDIQGKVAINFYCLKCGMDKDTYEKAKSIIVPTEELWARILMRRQELGIAQPTP